MNQAPPPLRAEVRLDTRSRGGGLVQILNPPQKSAWTLGAGTRQEARNRGAQGWLVRHRVHDKEGGVSGPPPPLF